MHPQAGAYAPQAGNPAPQPVNQPSGQRLAPNVVPNAVPRANPLIYVAGILLIAIGFYFVVNAILNIANWLIYFGGSTYLSITMFPWGSVAFGTFVSLVMIFTGIISFIFAKSVQKSLFIVIAASATGLLILIRVVRSIVGFIGWYAEYGGTTVPSSTFFGLVPVSYPVSFALDNCALLLAVAAAAVLVVCALSNKRKQ